LSEEIDVDIYPIIGVGSAPFRGNLTPQNVDKLALEYPSAHTFTIQSSFKYDHPTNEVIKGVEKLKKRKPSNPQEVDENRFMEIINKYSPEYEKQILSLAPTINKIAKYTPLRRKRKLHIGLFGYSRDMKGVSLPRAISFTCALYSIGVPPEILALNALNEDDLSFINKHYLNLQNDLKDALKYLNNDSPFLPEPVKEKLDLIDYEVHEEHKKITDNLIELLRKDKMDNAAELILRAAYLRKFIG
jgi:phosphoenolpyruvate carboxylase